MSAEQDWDYCLHCFEIWRGSLLGPADNIGLGDRDPIAQPVDSPVPADEVVSVFLAPQDRWEQFRDPLTQHARQLDPEWFKFDKTLWAQAKSRAAATGDEK